MKSLTQRLAEFIVELNYEDLAPEVVHEAKRVILDSVGCALGGMDTDKGKLSVELAKRLGGPAESSILGAKDKVSCANAAFANGELINALDFDVILKPAVHVTPFVLPPALALAESTSSSGKQLILASVLGHEISSRLAAALTGSTIIVNDGPDRGKITRPAVHGYSVNAFGSAASAAKVLKLDVDRLTNALGIAGYNAPMQAQRQWERSGTDALMKYGSAGWIAQVGTTAALLAEIGYTGDTTVLDGDYSYWRFSGSQRWDPDVVLEGLGQDWHILNVRYKRYPCCGITHTALDCFTHIVEENKLAPDHIKHVKVWLDPLSEEPLWQGRRIDNEVQAQFSVPYDLAVAAHRVALGAEWLDPSTRSNSKVRSFMDKVSVSPHPDFGKAALEHKGAQIARVEVQANGKSYAYEKRYSSGRATPETAKISDLELEQKFSHNASGILVEKKTGEIVKSLWNLEELNDVSHLMTLLRG